MRNQFIQRQQAKLPDCDVLQSDIIWTAEFAQQKWLLDMTEYVDARKGEFIPSTLASYDYDGKFWGVPQVSGAGLLYRRTDQVADVPASWQELYAEGASTTASRSRARPTKGSRATSSSSPARPAGASSPRTARRPSSTARRTSRRCS